MIFIEPPNLIHPDFAIADHDALVAGEQMSALAAATAALTSGVNTRA
jgi:hypothetical protein